jgi:Glycogen debranching enzyme N terminal
VAGSLTRRYHGPLVAALDPPLGRTLLVAEPETVTYDGLSGRSPPIAGAGAVDPTGYVTIERFTLEGTTPVGTYATSCLGPDARSSQVHIVVTSSRTR